MNTLAKVFVVVCVGAGSWGVLAALSAISFMHFLSYDIFHINSFGVSVRFIISTCAVVYTWRKIK